MNHAKAALGGSRGHGSKRWKTCDASCRNKIVVKSLSLSLKKSMNVGVTFNLLQRWMNRAKRHHVDVSPFRIQIGAPNQEGKTGGYAMYDDFAQ